MKLCWQLGIACVLTTAMMGLSCVGPGSQAGVAHVPENSTVFVPGNNVEHVWERTVDVLHDYGFPVAVENKLDGIIQTEYKVGSGILEPWHQESVGHENRWESTFQSIRRRVFVSVIPAEGGYLVSVECFKELEDLPSVTGNSAGSATFQESSPLQRDREVTAGQTAPKGWIPQGHDVAVEQAMVARLRAAYSR